MNKTLMAAGLAVVLGACNSSKKSDGVDTSAVNPFFTEYTTPFGVPPFEQIKVDLQNCFPKRNGGTNSRSRGDRKQSGQSYF